MCDRPPEKTGPGLEQGCAVGGEERQLNWTGRVTPGWTASHGVHRKRRPRCFAGQRRFHLGNLDELNPKRLFEALDKLGDLGLHPVEPRLNCVPGRGGSIARQARGADRVRNVSCTESI